MRSSNKKIPKASTDPEDYTRNSSSPIPQPTRERWSWEPTRESPFCCGERSRTIYRILGVKRSSTYYGEYASGRRHACGLASDPISFASQRRDPSGRPPFPAGLLAHGSPYSPRLPIHESDSGIHRFRPHLQRRDHEGLAPSSLTQESYCGRHSRRAGRRLSRSLLSIVLGPTHATTPDI